MYPASLSATLVIFQTFCNIAFYFCLYRMNLFITFFATVTRRALGPTDHPILARYKRPLLSGKIQITECRFDIRLTVHP